MKKNLVVSSLFLAALFAIIYSPTSSAQQVEKKQSDDFQPVDNMHHFMEYIYEPIYKELKPFTEKEPADKKAWSTMKKDAMILSEASTLLAQRVPTKGDADEWKKWSLQVHKYGAELYQAARKKDFENAKKHFAAMSEGCAKCHESFRSKD